MKISGASIGLGRRLKWPDDYFTLYNDLSFQQYHLNNYGNIFGISDGFSYIVSFKTVLSRSSQDQMIYPRRGSAFSMGLQLTPPYSLFSNKDYATIPDEEKYKWIEFHKWTFKSAWYTSLIGNLVLATKAEFGYLGMYNKDIGSSPYEKFDVGGSGMAYNDFYYGTDIVALRGYDEGSVTPTNILGEKNGNLYNKYTMELRYPITLNPSATLFGLAFLEAGNSYQTIQEFNPFHNYKSAGVGIRAFLPMFGLLGIDFGYGFDALPGESQAHGWEYHFILGQQL
jgi:outer membrane protein insertion porin family